jgi:hypothetical protein
LIPFSATSTLYWGSTITYVALPERQLALQRRGTKSGQRKLNFELKSLLGNLPLFIILLDFFKIFNDCFCVTCANPGTAKKFTIHIMFKDVPESCASKPAAVIEF